MTCCCRASIGLIWNRGCRLLSARERTALMLRDVEGLRADEVAGQMNCSKATVRRHIANARTKMLRYMEGRKR